MNRSSAKFVFHPCVSPFSPAADTHHLREQIFVHEQEQEDWAKRMHELLISTKSEVENHVERGALPPEFVLRIEQPYQQILTEDLMYHRSLPVTYCQTRERKTTRWKKSLGPSEGET